MIILLKGDVMTEYSEHRNPMVLFADDGVQKCYNKYIERVSYYERLMEQHISSTERYGWYGRMAAEYDLVLKTMRKNCIHCEHKNDVPTLIQKLIDKLTKRIYKYTTGRSDECQQTHLDSSGR
jgi:ribosome-associated translation inhibitor RaiA